MLWAARNGPGTLFRLIFNGTIWVARHRPTAGAPGKALRYPDGTGDPDAEGVTFAGAGSSGGIYVSTERNNSANSISRNSILRFDPAAAGHDAHRDQRVEPHRRSAVAGANLGIEAITWIPDTFLVSKGFFDESKNHTYNPAEYPNHGTGLFFVGLEANGMVYAYALDHVEQRLHPARHHRHRLRRRDGSPVRPRPERSVGRLRRHLPGPLGRPAGRCAPASSRWPAASSGRPACRT